MWAADVKSKGYALNCEDHKLRAPIFEALDQLRLALDIAMEQDNQHAAGLLIWAISDVVDTLDLIDLKPDPFEVLAHQRP